MVDLVFKGFVGYGSDSGALVSSLYDLEWVAIHSGILYQSKCRAIHFNNPRSHPAPVFLHSRLAIADVSLDVPSDIRAAANVRQERSHPYMVGGRSIRFLFVVGIETSRLHPADGAADRNTHRQRAAAAGITCVSSSRIH